MKIVSDSSIMFDVAEGARRGIEILPLAVTIEDETWLEYEEMPTDDFLARVRAGATPKSSCPPPDLTLKAYDTEEEVLHITMADGLSGAYGVACGLQKQARHPERVKVINSTTLCVPERAIVLVANELAKAGKPMNEILDHIRPMIESSHSFLIPEDFDFLRRGGRLTPLAAKFVGLLKVVPVMCTTEDGTRIERLSVVRNFKKGISAVASGMKKRGVGKGHFVSISHADAPAKAKLMLEGLKEKFPECRFGLYNLGPAFITQGGPSCIAVQLVNLGSFSDMCLD